MATGYTHPVAERDDMTFREFATRCAYNFAPLYGEAHDRSPHDELPVDVARGRDLASYENDVAEAQLDLSVAESLTLKEAAAACESEYAERVRARDAINASAALERSRFRAMLAKVQAWKPPTPAHEGLKRFMEQQLLSSIDDVVDASFTPARRDPEEYLVSNIEVWRYRVAEAERRLTEVRASRAADQAWVDALRESLKEAT